MNLDDETLMAFADGGLHAEEAARVACAVAADPALAERVAHLRAGGEAARRAFIDVLEEPVPARLVAALRDGAGVAGVMPARPLPPRLRHGADAPRRWHRRPGPRLGLAIAASLVLGLVGGWSLRGDGSGPGRIGPALAAALDGEASGGAGETRLLASHALADGGACRVFVAPDGAGVLSGLACRDAAGPWRLRALVARRAAPQGFAPASAEDPLLGEILERLGAGPALTPAEEHDAIRRGWQPRR